ncbi:hypothetical protein COU59_00550 [Candidatus Pacearchaeota archaeon CG10_big_fil_rev_8_21_14_0_10_34_12]|nr:MAG: hypothetical protein COU59_00550 [Candidatus Pacearchaeota archaeon CG10_big_fil_rev_8_21_14_0_10_34_12]
MKKSVFSLIFVVFLISFVSAEIIINPVQNEVYNLGNIITIPATVKTTSSITGTFEMSLLCNGKSINFYKNGINLGSGEEKRIEASLVLNKNIIGESKGDCKIKATLGTDSALTNEFRISDTIKINLQTEQKEFDPKENIIMKGTAVKENGEDVNGFLEMGVVMGNESDTRMYYESVNNGFFSVNFSMPKDARAGQYLLKLKIYEKDSSNEITNNGFTDYNILIRQIPTSLEIVFDNKNVEPGTNLKVKTILHDQTGEKIPSSAIMTIKDGENKILEQREISTDEYMEYSVNYDEKPSNWTVVSVSNRMTTNSFFTIDSKEIAGVTIINKTVTVTNTGNVPYNKTFLIKIGDYSSNINVYLEVNEEKKYILSAPDGEYDVEVISEGESKLTEKVLLTGDAINIKEISRFNFVNFPVIFIFVIFVLGFIVFMMFRKGQQKTFFGYVKKWGKNKSNNVEGNSIQNIPKMEESSSENKGPLMDFKSNKAELSLSLNGEKQGTVAICLRIKNLAEISRKDESIKDTLRKINLIVSDNKGFTYENQDDLFFLLIPLITRTFKNERKAIEIANKMKNILENHNKMFKQKIDFGISLNYGDIIAKKEKDVLKFMSFGAFMNSSKKIASLANGDIYLSDNFGKRAMHEVKAEKKNIQGVEVYVIKELKEKREEHKKFISQFIRRLERDNKDKRKEEEGD